MPPPSFGFFVRPRPGPTRGPRFAPASGTHFRPVPTRQLVGAALVALADAQCLGPGRGAGSVWGAEWRSAGHALAPRAFATRVFSE